MIREVHLSASGIVYGEPTEVGKKGEGFGFGEEAAWRLDRGKLEGVRDAIKRWDMRRGAVG